MSEIKNGGLDLDGKMYQKQWTVKKTEKEGESLSSQLRLKKDKSKKKS